MCAINAGVNFIHSALANEDDGCYSYVSCALIGRSRLCMGAEAQIKVASTPRPEGRGY
jgi:hypothetical protein